MCFYHLQTFYKYQVFVHLGENMHTLLLMYLYYIVLLSVWNIVSHSQAQSFIHLYLYSFISFDLWHLSFQFEDD